MSDNSSDSGSSDSGLAERIVGDILDRPKYRSLSPATVADAVRSSARSIGGARSGDALRRAIDADARRRLHTIKADFLLAATPKRVEARLTRMMAEDPDDVAGVCRLALSLHRSSAERSMPSGPLFDRLLGLAGGAEEVADLGCAMGPFHLPLLDGPPPFRYRGVDLNRFYVDLPHRVLDHRFVGTTEHHDIALDRALTTDVALFLKTYHCSDARHRGQGLTVVDRVRARCVIVTVPLHGLGGRPLPAATRCEEELRSAATERRWTITTDRLEDELAIAVHKERGG